MKGTLGSLGEFGLIHRLTEGLKQGQSVRHGIGDDCAVVEIGGKEVLLTCDASLEDVHFKRDWGRPEDIGWKAAVSALSDIAAMGGRATVVLVTLALPPDLPLPYVEGLYRGISRAVESAGAVIVGGDTTASSSGIVIDLSVLGEVLGRPVLRRGAKPGDRIAATGALGERGAGLHALLNGVDSAELIQAYLGPIPRLQEGQWLQAQAGVHAMMDISDGLLSDLRHLAEASGVGVSVESGDLPAHTALEDYWQARGENCATMRLRSGEEYELLVVLAEGAAAAICREFGARFAVPLTVLGRCTEGPAVLRVDGAVPLDGGFAHFHSS